MLTFLVTNIAASAFAERARIPAYVLFSVVVSGKFCFYFDFHFEFFFRLFGRFCLSISCPLDVGRKWMAWCNRRCTSMSTIQFERTF